MEATMLSTGFTIVLAISIVLTCLYNLRDKE